MAVQMSWDQIKRLKEYYCRNNGDGEHKYQPFQIVSREKTGEVQGQCGDGGHIIQSE
jgi:hypothetical protein